MATDRATALSKLEALVNTASVNTVVRANEAVELDKYTESQLPLVCIIPGDEVPTYEVGRHALWRFATTIVVYFLGERKDEATQETLVGEIKNALGGDPTLSDTVEMVDILSISSGGEFPIYTITFECEVTYEKHIATA